MCSDPTGKWIWILIGAIFGGISSAASGGDFWQGFVMGAIAGAIGEGVGEVFKAFKVATTVWSSMASGAIGGGLTSVAFGGDFWSGALQGGLAGGLSYELNDIIKGGNSVKDIAKSKHPVNEAFKFGFKKEFMALVLHSNQKDVLTQMLESWFYDQIENGHYPGWGSGSSSNGDEEAIDSSKFASMTKEEKMEYIFGKNGSPYKTYEEAKAHMKEVEVKVWKYDEKTGKKYSSTEMLVVNEKLVKVVKAIFNEIYNDPERFPINVTSSFRWPDPYINHPNGTAIDINPDQNYMIKNGAILCGKEWSPGMNVLSMPSNGSVVNIFKKYGWDWGGSWRSCKDYMHFSFLGG